jgi:hypothetical protein
LLKDFATGGGATPPRRCSMTAPLRGALSMQKAISYIRVSTGKQGKSGLGIEAQRQAIARFASTGGIKVLDEFVEVETGKGTDALNRRPKLAEAL